MTTASTKSAPRSPPSDRLPAGALGAGTTPPTRRCVLVVLRVADRAKQTRSRAKSRSRRRSKARSTSTEEQRTKQHDIIEARQRSKAHTARRRSKALRRLSLAARRHRGSRLHCKALAHTYVFFFFPVLLLPPVLSLVQATRRRPGYAHAGLLMRPDLAVMPPKKPPE